MAMASRKTGGGSRNVFSKGRGRKGGAVSLIEADRDALDERLGEARAAGAAGAESMSGLFEALERFGLSSDRVERLRGAIDDMDVRESVEKAQEYLGQQIENARDYARENPGKVIGGAAGVLVGASLLAMALRRAGADTKSSSSRSSSRPSSSKARSTGGGPKSSSKSKSRSGSKSPAAGGSKSSGSSKKSGSKKSGSRSRR